MNNEQNNYWKRPWHGPRGILLWWMLVAAVSFVILLIGSFAWDWGMAPGFGGRMAESGVIAIAIAVLGVLGTLLVRSLSSWRRFRWVLFGAACLVTLFALAHAVENWRGHRAWKKYQDYAASKGERFDVANIVPQPVPDAENFAMAAIFEDVRNEMDPEWRRANNPDEPGHTNRLDMSIYGKSRDSRDVSLGSWMRGVKTDLEAWQTYYRESTVDPEAGMDPVIAKRYGIKLPDPPSRETANPQINEFPVSNRPQSPGADVLLALSKFDPALEELRDASSRPYSRFPVRYEDGFNALLPHLAKMKGLTQFLALRAVAALEEGRTNEALEDVQLSLRLIDSIRTEPILISHLVRVAQMHITLQPIWEGLADRRWNEAQLAAIQHELEQFDFLADYQLAMRGERALSIGAVDYLRRTRDPGFLDYQASPDSAPKRMLFRLAVPRGWFDQNKVSMARLHLELLMPALDFDGRVVSPGAYQKMDREMEQRLTRRTPYNFFAAMLMPALGSVVTKLGRIQGALDLAIVACALERHYLAHGEYPRTLDQLTPQFIARLPHDIVNGQPLVYQRTGDGRFKLYSVGWNQADDGGEIALTSSGNVDWDKGDWVWRYAD
jgi:hypothetical protein